MGKALPTVSLKKSLFGNSDFRQWSKIRRKPAATQGKGAVAWFLITQGALEQGQCAMAQYKSLLSLCTVRTTSWTMLKHLNPLLLYTTRSVKWSQRSPRSKEVKIEMDARDLIHNTLHGANPKQVVHFANSPSPLCTLPKHRVQNTAKIITTKPTDRVNEREAFKRWKCTGLI